MKMIIKDIANFVKKNDNFLISGHQHADGDAISAMLSFSICLEQLGKSYQMVLDDQIPDQRYTFLKNFSKIEWVGSIKETKIETAVVFDTPSRERTGEVKEILPALSQTVKIDHHPPEKGDFAHLVWVDVGSSSTTCMVYQLLEELQVTWTRDLAQVIVTGIMYDTGRFSYSNTKVLDFLIVAKMLEQGADINLSYRKIFCDISQNALVIVGKGLASLKTYCEGKVGIIFLEHHEVIKSKPGEVEVLASYTTQIRGTEVGLFIREEEKHKKYKISFRSKGRVNVNLVARVFSGGGHQKASGCRIEAGSYVEVRTQLLREIQKQL